MSTEYLLEEKRRSRRSDARDLFLIEFRKWKRKTVYVGFGGDVSSGGIRFLTQEKLDEGDVIRIVMHFPPRFPGRKKIKFLAEVIRQYRPRGSRFYRIGCKLSRVLRPVSETIWQFQVWIETQQ